jgi:vitamin B12 transporter
VLAGDRWLELSQSGRLDQHDREGNNATWRSGAAVFPIDPLKLHGSVGTTFRAPSLYELNGPFVGNQDLDAQRARTADAGFQVRLPGGFSAGSAWFRTDYRRAIEFDNVSFTYQNVDGYRIDGVENHADWQQDGGGATIRATATWQRTDLSEAEIGGGRSFANLPQRKGLLEAGWDDLERWWVLGRIELVGSRIAFGGADLPGYGVLGASAGWRIDGTWQVYGRAENLLDKAYEVSRGYATPGRSGYAGVEATF